MAEHPVNAWQKTIRTRILIAAALFAAWSVVIEGQLVHLQVFRRAALQARADDQSLSTLRVPAKRGDILDRNGQVLATSVDAEAICADPTQIDDPAATAAALCEVLTGCMPRERDEIAAKLSKRRPNGQKALFAYVRRANRVTEEDARRVAALGLPGVGFMKEWRRAYPNNESAAHVLGYVGTDNIGLSGIEAAYKKYLCGRDGTVLIQHTVRRAYGRLGDEGTPGSTLELTIDEYLQHVAERELHAAVEENRAAGGSVIIMVPSTGEVLAMANEPTFNPNRYGEATPDQRRNRAIQDVYEPGSTFKIVTASAALDEGVMSPDAVLDVSGGLIHLPGRPPVHDTHDYGALSFTDVIVKSSNVGAIKIGLRLGAERLGRYVQRFGFGTRLSPDLGGENAGIVWDPAHWNESALASVAMGYQISVTPLQMATAASTVANGGSLVQPRVVKAIIGRDGTRTEIAPRVLRRAIAKSTADELTSIMEGVVERGTATVARIPGYTIAGKTGTAHKLENGHYSASDYNASFVGFLPTRNPAVTIIVVIDSPHGSHGYFGGSVAAPAFKRIAETAMRYLGIGPDLTAPALVFTQPRTAQRASVLPSPGDRVTIVRTGTSQRGERGVVPDLIGLSAREAIRVLARIGVTPRLSGDGVVVQQDPPPGAAVDPGKPCSLALGRPAAPTTGPDQRQ